ARGRHHGRARGRRRVAVDAVAASLSPPRAAAGLRFGVAGGLIAALGAVLGVGPFVLREIEGHGPTRAAAEGIVTLAVLAGSGALVGSLAPRARRQRERYETPRAAQRAPAEPTPR